MATSPVVPDSMITESSRKKASKEHGDSLLKARYCPPDRPAATLCEGLAKEGARHHGYTGARGYHPLHGCSEIRRRRRLFCH